MDFRTDINGLRAIAVIAVVIFHFNESWLPGGFIGVDLFFVISGFLMTGIIFKGLKKNNFSILKFYISRANRIIPSLALLCFTMLIIGFYFLSPTEFQTLSKHVASSVGFVSNIIYLRESGYFESLSHEKWLLHTWSLSVEWQFYLAYPLFLVILKRFFSLSVVRRAILLGAILGFFFSVYVTYFFPNYSYYALPSRAWEMLAGGVAYLYPIYVKERYKKVLESAGLLLIIFSCIFISKNTPWPGHLALFPVIGVLFVLYSKCNNSMITNNYALQRIGDWSYSIYLWHWPIVVLFYSLSINEAFIPIGILLALILGFLNRKYIECINFKKDFNKTLYCLKSVPVLLTLFVGGISVVFYINIASKISNIPNVEQYSMVNRHGETYCFTPSGSNSRVGHKSNLSCVIGDKLNAPKVLVLGDSFMGHYEPLLKLIATELDISMLSLTSGSCFPSLSLKEHGLKGNPLIAQCLMNREYAKDNIEDFDTVIISARWDKEYAHAGNILEDTKEFISFVTNKEINVIFFPVPTIYKSDIGKIYLDSVIAGYKFKEENSKVFPNHQKTKYNEQMSENLKRHFEKNKHFLYIDKELFFNKSDMFKHNYNLVPYSADGSHISVLGAQSIYPKIKENGTYDLIINRLIY